MFLITVAHLLAAFFSLYFDGSAVSNCAGSENKRSPGFRASAASRKGLWTQFQPASPFVSALVITSALLSTITKNGRRLTLSLSLCFSFFLAPDDRQHDAGVLSVGIDPNWKHIVPPGQRRVVSEAHCVSDCTQQALPPRGINVFAVNQHTHLLGEWRRQHFLSKTAPLRQTSSHGDAHWPERLFPELWRFPL